MRESNLNTQNNFHCAFTPVGNLIKMCRVWKWNMPMDWSRIRLNMEGVSFGLFEHMRNHINNQMVYNKFGIWDCRKILMYSCSYPSSVTPTLHEDQIKLYTFSRTAKPRQKNQCMLWYKNNEENFHWKYFPMGWVFNEIRGNKIHAVEWLAPLLRYLEIFDLYLDSENGNTDRYIRSISQARHLNFWDSTLNWITAASFRIFSNSFLLIFTSFDAIFSELLKKS